MFVPHAHQVVAYLCLSMSFVSNKTQDRTDSKKNSEKTNIEEFKQVKSTSFC